MKKIYVLLSLSLIIQTNAKSQQKKDSIRFSAIASMARLSGESQKLFAYQAVAGLRWQSWFGGIGAAYDRYGYKSIPVFFDIRRYINAKKSWQPYVYGDAGVNLALYSDQMPRKSDDRDYVTFRPAFYGEAGVGIDKRVSRKLAFSLSAGYSYKQFSYVKYNQFSIWSNVRERDNSQRFDYHYRRYSIKLGIRVF